MLIPQSRQLHWLKLPRESNPNRPFKNCCSRVSTRVFLQNHYSQTKWSVPLKIALWTDYLKLEPASCFNNEIVNWLFEYWTRSFDPRIQLTGSVFEKSLHYCILKKTSTKVSNLLVAIVNWFCIDFVLVRVLFNTHISFWLSVANKACYCRRLGFNGMLLVLHEDMQGHNTCTNYEASYHYYCLFIFILLYVCTRLSW